MKIKSLPSMQKNELKLIKDLIGSQDKFQNLHEETLKVLTSQFAIGLDSEEILGERKVGHL